MRGMIWLGGCLALVVALGSAARADEPAGCPALCEGGCAKCAGTCDEKCAGQCSGDCCSGDTEEVADDDTSLSVSATLWIAHQLLPGSCSDACQDYTAIVKGTHVR